MNSLLSKVHVSKMSTKLNTATTVTTSKDEKTFPVSTQTKHCLVKKKVKWYQSGSPPKLYDAKVVLTRIEAANIVPLPGGIGFSVPPLSAAINPLNMYQVPGIGNYPARKAKRNADVALTCCLGCASNSPCKRAKTSGTRPQQQFVKNTGKKRKYVKRKIAKPGNVSLEVTTGNHLPVAMIDAPRTEKPAHSISDLDGTLLSSVGPSAVRAPFHLPRGMVFSTNQVTECPVRPSIFHGTLYYPLHQEQAIFDVSFPGITPQGQSLSHSHSALLIPSSSSDLSRRQVSSNFDCVTGFPINRCQASATSTEEVHVVFSQAGFTGGTASVPDNSSLPTAIACISSATCSTAVPTPITTHAPSTSSGGVSSLQHSQYPLQPTAMARELPPLQQPYISPFAVCGAPSLLPSFVPLAGQQTGNIFIPGAQNFMYPLPIHSAMQYSSLPVVNNSGQPLTNVALAFSSNLPPPNGQSLASLGPQPLTGNDGVGTSGTGVGQQKDQVATKSTSVGHEKDHVGSGVTNVAHHKDYVGTCSNTSLQQKDHAGTSTASISHSKGSVGSSGTNVEHRTDHVGTCSTSIVHQKDPVCSGITNIPQERNHVSARSASVSHRADHVASGNETENSSVSGESTFSISSLLHQVTDNKLKTWLESESTESVTEQISKTRTSHLLTRPRRMAETKKTRVEEACCMLERALSLVTTRDVSDYGWLVDRYCCSLKQEKSTPETIVGVTSLKKLIDRTVTDLTVQNLLMQKWCLKLQQQIETYQENVRKEEAKYRNILRNKLGAEERDQDTSPLEAEIETLSSKIKDLVSEIDDLDRKWSLKEGQG